jgi:F-type H+/Na+-transporting ATPase subunit alpha
MKFNSDEIAAVIQKEIETFGSQVDVREVGTVLEVGDGIGLWTFECHVRGNG